MVGTERTRRSTPPSEGERRRRFRPAYLLILAAMVLFSVKFVQKTWEAHQLSQQLVAEQRHAALVDQTNAQLQRNIRYYRTDQYVEDAARQQGYVRPGDRPVIVASTSHLQTVRPAPHYAVHPAKRIPSWKQWLDVFFGSQ